MVDHIRLVLLKYSNFVKEKSKSIQSNKSLLVYKIGEQMQDWSYMIKLDSVKNFCSVNY